VPRQDEDPFARHGSARAFDPRTQARGGAAAIVMAMVEDVVRRNSVDDIALRWRASPPVLRPRLSSRVLMITYLPRQPLR
jgi:hypothetical protein